MKFKPYVSYSLLRMAHFRGFNSPKIPRGPRGIGSRSPNPRGMKKCNPRFLESQRNENRSLRVQDTLGLYIEITGIHRFPLLMWGHKKETLEAKAA